MLNLHLLECTVKGYDHISDLLFAKYWVITGCKYWNCTSLTSVTIPDSVTTIGFGAFYVCKSLSRITIGKNVRKIDMKAFQGCSNIDTIICCATTPPRLYISSDSTSSSFKKFETLVVPIGCEEAYANSDWGKYL